MLCTIVDRRTRLLLQPRLDLLPDCFFNDNRIEVLVAKPVRFIDGSRFAAEIFPAVIDQHAGIGFLWSKFLCRIPFRMLSLTGRKLENRFFEEEVT